MSCPEINSLNAFVKKKTTSIRDKLFIVIDEKLSDMPQEYESEYQNKIVIRGEAWARSAYRLGNESWSGQNVLDLKLPLTVPLTNQKHLRISLCEPSGKCVSEFELVLDVTVGTNVSFAAAQSYHPMMASVESRDDFPLALAMMNQRVGTIVEVGVRLAEFSVRMLTLWPGGKYILVDPWEHVASRDEYFDSANVEDQESIYFRALAAIEPFGTVPAVMRMRSLDAAALLVDNTIDLVYIDALHHYQGVMSDMHAWWPKLRRGGILAGHDFLLDYKADTIFTVRPAVEEFARKMGLVLFRTYDGFATWYFVKP